MLVLSKSIISDINYRLSDFILGEFTEIKKSFYWGELHIYKWDDTSWHIDITINKDKRDDCIVVWNSKEPKGGDAV